MSQTERQSHIAEVTQHRVVAVRRADRVVPRSADDDVVTRATGDRIGRRTRTVAADDRTREFTAERDRRVIADQHVRAGRRRDRIAADSADDDVASAVHRDRVRRAHADLCTLDARDQSARKRDRAVIAQQHIATTAVGERIAAAAAEQHAVPVAAGDRVIAVEVGLRRDLRDDSRVQQDVRRIADQDVVAATAADRVVARSTDQPVRRAIAGEVVVARTADDSLDVRDRPAPVVVTVENDRHRAREARKIFGVVAPLPIDLPADTRPAREHEAVLLIAAAQVLEAGEQIDAADVAGVVRGHVPGRLVRDRADRNRNNQPIRVRSAGQSHRCRGQSAADRHRAADAVGRSVVTRHEQLADRSDGRARLDVGVVERSQCRIDRRIDRRTTADRQIVRRRQRHGTSRAAHGRLIVDRQMVAAAGLGRRERHRAIRNHVFADDQCPARRDVDATGDRYLNGQRNLNDRDDRDTEPEKVGIGDVTRDGSWDVNGDVVNTVVPSVQPDRSADAADGQPAGVRDEHAADPRIGFEVVDCHIERVRRRADTRSRDQHCRIRRDVCTRRVAAVEDRSSAAGGDRHRIARRDRTDQRNVNRLGAAVGRRQNHVVTRRDVLHAQCERGESPPHSRSGLLDIRAVAQEQVHVAVHRADVGQIGRQRRIAIRGQHGEVREDTFAPAETIQPRHEIHADWQTQPQALRRTSHEPLAGGNVEHSAADDPARSRQDVAAGTRVRDGGRAQRIVDVASQQQVPRVSPADVDLRGIGVRQDRAAERVAPLRAGNLNGRGRPRLVVDVDVADDELLVRIIRDVDLIERDVERPRRRAGDRAERRAQDHATACVVGNVPQNRLRAIDGLPHMPFTGAIEDPSLGELGDDTRRVDFDFRIDARPHGDRRIQDDVVAQAVVAAFVGMRLRPFDDLHDHFADLRHESLDRPRNCFRLTEQPAEAQNIRDDFDRVAHDRFDELDDRPDDRLQQSDRVVFGIADVARIAVRHVRFDIEHLGVDAGTERRGDVGIHVAHVVGDRDDLSGHGQRACVGMRVGVRRSDVRSQRHAVTGVDCRAAADAGEIVQNRIDLRFGRVDADEAGGRLAAGVRPDIQRRNRVEREVLHRDQHVVTDIREALAAGQVGNRPREVAGERSDHILIDGREQRLHQERRDGQVRVRRIYRRVVAQPSLSQRVDEIHAGIGRTRSDQPTRAADHVDVRVVVGGRIEQQIVAAENLRAIEAAGIIGHSDGAVAHRHVRGRRADARQAERSAEAVRIDVVARMRRHGQFIADGQDRSAADVRVNRRVHVDRDFRATNADCSAASRRRSSRDHAAGVEIAVLRVVVVAHQCDVVARRQPRVRSHAHIDIRPPIRDRLRSAHRDETATGTVGRTARIAQRRRDHVDRTTRLNRAARSDRCFRTRRRIGRRLRSGKIDHAAARSVRVSVPVGRAARNQRHVPSRRQRLDAAQLGLADAVRIRRALHRSDCHQAAGVAIRVRVRVVGRERHHTHIAARVESHVAGREGLRVRVRRGDRLRRRGCDQSARRGIGLGVRSLTVLVVERRQRNVAAGCRHVRVRIDERVDVGRHRRGRVHRTDTQQATRPARRDRVRVGVADGHHADVAADLHVRAVRAVADLTDDDRRGGRIRARDVGRRQSTARRAAVRVRRVRGLSQHRQAAAARDVAFHSNLRRSILAEREVIAIRVRIHEHRAEAQQAADGTGPVRIRVIPSTRLHRNDATRRTQRRAEVDRRIGPRRGRGVNVRTRRRRDATAARVAGRLSFLRQHRSVRRDVVQRLDHQLVARVDRRPRTNLREDVRRHQRLCPGRSERHAECRRNTRTPRESVPFRASRHEHVIARVDVRAARDRGFHGRIDACERDIRGDARHQTAADRQHVRVRVVERLAQDLDIACRVDRRADDLGARAAANRCVRETSSEAANQPRSSAGRVRFGNVVRRGPQLHVAGRLDVRAAVDGRVHIRRRIGGRLGPGCSADQRDCRVDRAGLRSLIQPTACRRDVVQRAQRKVRRVDRHVRADRRVERRRHRRIGERCSGRREQRRRRADRVRIGETARQRIDRRIAGQRDVRVVPDRRRDRRPHFGLSHRTGDRAGEQTGVRRDRLSRRAIVRIGRDGQVSHRLPGLLADVRAAHVGDRRTADVAEHDRRPGRRSGRQIPADRLRVVNTIRFRVNRHRAACAIDVRSAVDVRKLAGMIVDHQHLRSQAHRERERTGVAASVNVVGERRPDVDVAVRARAGSHRRTVVDVRFRLRADGHDRDGCSDRTATRRDGTDQHRKVDAFVRADVDIVTRFDGRSAGDVGRCAGCRHRIRRVRHDGVADTVAGRSARADRAAGNERRERLVAAAARREIDRVARERVRSLGRELHFVRARLDDVVRRPVRQSADGRSAIRAIDERLAVVESVIVAERDRVVGDTRGRTGRECLAALVSAEHRRVTALRIVAPGEPVRLAERIEAALHVESVVTAVIDRVRRTECSTNRPDRHRTRRRDHAERPADRVGLHVAIGQSVDLDIVLG